MPARRRPVDDQNMDAVVSRVAPAARAEERLLAHCACLERLTAIDRMSARRRLEHELGGHLTELLVGDLSRPRR
jgi:hypothetical protein